MQGLNFKGDPRLQSLLHNFPSFSALFRVQMKEVYTRRKGTELDCRSVKGGCFEQFSCHIKQFHVACRKAFDVKKSGCRIGKEFYFSSVNIISTNGAIQLIAGDVPASTIGRPCSLSLR